MGVREDLGILKDAVLTTPIIFHRLGGTPQGIRKLGGAAMIHRSTVLPGQGGVLVEQP